LFSRIQQLENNFTTITKKIEEEDTHEEKQIERDRDASRVNHRSE
jgi:hypothetical protein